MKKYLGITWVEFVAIFVAVCVAMTARDMFKTVWYLDAIVYFIAWFISFAISIIVIKKILKWTGKN